MKRISELLNKYRWLKFLIVGGLGVPIHFGILFGLTTSGLWYVASLIIAILIAASFNYILNHYWTFRNYWRHSFLNGLTRYLVITSIFDGIYLALTILLKEHTKLNQYELGYLIAAGIAMFIVMIARYTVVSRIVWRRHGRITESI